MLNSPKRFFILMLPNSSSSPSDTLLTKRHNREGWDPVVPPQQALS